MEYVQERADTRIQGQGHASCSIKKRLFPEIDNQGRMRAHHLYHLPNLHTKPTQHPRLSTYPPLPTSTTSTQTHKNRKTKKLSSLKCLDPGSNRGSSHYECDALPLSHRGGACCSFFSSLVCRPPSSASINDSSMIQKEKRKGSIHLSTK